MAQKIKRLLSYYEELSKRYQIEDSTEKYASLVTAELNRAPPIQRWYHLKESFSLTLLETLIDDWRISPDSIRRVLDPFCGIGTTLLAVHQMAKRWGLDEIEAIGIETNPFIHFVADTKVRWHEFAPQFIEECADHLLNGAYKPVPNAIPSLSTLHRSDVYPSDVLVSLISWREAIKLHAKERNERDALLLAYASILEPTSGVRKDGRALRIVRDKERAAVHSALERAWAIMVHDLRIAEQHYRPIPTSVILGDGRTLTATDKSGESTTRLLTDVDLAIFSPPYLNNIDYTEVYKIELWMCEHVQTADQFRELRHRTFRSHPSVRFRKPTGIEDLPELNEVCQILDSLVDALPRDRYFSWRRDLFRAYFDDMYQTLRFQKEALSDRGWIFCIIGNSLHGSRKKAGLAVPIASDLLVAAIADALGFKVERIQVARYLPRRSPSNDLLRESIIVLRP